MSVNQSALTGESQDADKHTGDQVYSGSIVSRNEATAVVITTGLKTYFGKTIELVKTAKPKSHMDEVIFGLLKWLVLAVSATLVIATAIAYFRGVNLFEILPLMLVLLMRAIPVSMTAMFFVSMALGTRQFVKDGVLITRLNAPDDAASMDVMCVDKTGTLTRNKLSVVKVNAADGFSEDDVSLYGAMASNEMDDPQTGFYRYGVGVADDIAGIRTAVYRLASLGVEYERRAVEHIQL